jgi:hypothetical protein
LKRHSAGVSSNGLDNGPNEHHEDEEIEDNKNACSRIAPGLDIDHQQVEEAEGNEEDD